MPAFLLARNHDDKQVDALIDRMKEAGTEEAFLQAGYDFNATSPKT
jgi:hypothetical protein